MPHRRRFEKIFIVWQNEITRSRLKPAKATQHSDKTTPVYPEQAINNRDGQGLRRNILFAKRRARGQRAQPYNIDIYFTRRLAALFRHDTV